MNKAYKDFVLLSFDPHKNNIDEVASIMRDAKEIFPDYNIVMFPKGIDIEGFFDKEDALEFLENVIKQIKEL